MWEEYFESDDTLIIHFEVEYQSSTKRLCFDELSICYFRLGNENYDWEALENSAQYKGGYTSSDPTIRLFWEVFHELPLEEKKKFMLFLTGTDRIPIQGNY